MSVRLLTLVRDAGHRAETAAITAGSGIYSLDERRDLYARWLRGRQKLRDMGVDVAPLSAQHERHLLDLLDPKGVR